MTLWRPVYQRASLIAFSFASAPPFVKNVIEMSPGVTSASRRASVERGSVAIGGPIGDSSSPSFFVAATARGGLCAILTVTSREANAQNGVPVSADKEGAPAPA